MVMTYGLHNLAVVSLTNQNDKILMKRRILKLHTITKQLLIFFFLKSHLITKSGLGLQIYAISF